ncbi:hypothetical protein Pcinc_044345, partial [Petrolisthes cinctipes]
MRVSVSVTEGHQRSETLVNVIAAPAGSYGLLVQWTLINNTTSQQVGWFEVGWSGEGGEGEDGKDTVNGDTYEYNITDVEHCTTYNITVQPFSSQNDLTLGDPGVTQATTVTQ